MQRKDLALRVLSTAAIMSIVTSIAAPAFAGTYYMDNGNLSIRQDEYGKVWVKSGNSKELEDTDDEVIICGGAGDNKWSNGSSGGAALTSGTPAAEEQQPDPNAGSTLNETQEGSAQTKEGSAQTEEGSAQTKEGSAQTKEGSAQTEEGSAQTEEGSAQTEEGSAQTQQGKDTTKKEEDSPKDPSTEPAPTTSADPEEKTLKTTQADAPAADPAPATPAAGSVTPSTTNVIKVVNNWVGAAAKELKIRLSNVNIKTGNSAYEAAMTVSGGGTTKVELDGQNVLDSSEAWSQAGLRKQGKGTLIITDETDDTGKKITSDKTDGTGSLTAKGGYGNGAAGIGGGMSESTENITIEGYATVDATGGGSGAGIGGGSNGSATDGAAKNITIQGHSNVTARAGNGAAIGSGYGSYETSATGIVIRDYAVVDARATGGAAIGGGAHYGGNNNTEVDVTIGTDGKTEAKENVRVTAIGSGIAIGNGKKMTTVTIQGHVSILTASTNGGLAIGSGKGNVTVNIKDNVAIDTDDTAVNPDSFFGYSGIGGGNIDAGDSTRKVVVNIDGGKDGKVKLGEKSALSGYHGAISGTEVNIGDNVLLKMKQSARDGKYINMNGAEAEVGTRSNTPGASGLVNSIGDNTELWYSAYGRLQKIVHGKNICTKHETGRQNATCTEDGWVKYECTYERDNNAAYPEHTDQWTETIDALGHDFTVKQSETPATCETAGTIVWKCSRCDETKTQTIPALNHDYRDDWVVTTPATCTTEGVETRYCHNNNSHFETRPTALNGNNHGSHGTYIVGKKDATCTTDGYTGDTYCNGCNQKIKDGTVIPATGHHWVDNGNGTHTCTKCGATEALPSDTNSALELRVVDAEGMDQPFTVSQNGTLRTYTGAYDTATLTGDLDTLRYLQDHGAQTIQFVTNGQTSSFAINDLLAQGSGSEVFYLTHRGAEEPTLLLVEADHSELVKD